ncbi:MAG: signal peptide peptidase SppA [Candidatus Xenobium sp.]|jgi:protease-4
MQPTSVSSPAPRRPWSFWLALFLALALTGSVLLNILLGLAALGNNLDPGIRARFDETLLDGEHSAREKVVVLPIQGVIMEEGDGPGSLRSVSRIRSMLHAVRQDKSVKAVVLDIDSPGGGVTASDQIYHELSRFRQETEIPIVALFGDVAASGGYYVAMAADEILAHTTTITGSIGVISQIPQVRNLMDKIGVEILTIKSLDEKGQPSFKDMGSPFREMRPEERKILQGLVTQMWERFVQVVAEGRKGHLKPTQVRALADGRIFTGKQALDLKLIDALGYQEDAFRRARELGNAPQAKVVRLQHRETLLDLLGGAGFSTGKWSTPLRVLERATLQGPRMMYLWSGS